MLRGRDRMRLGIMGLTVCAAVGVQADGEWTDPRVRTLLMPHRVLWTSANTPSSRVENAEIVLKQKHGQVPEGLFLAGSGCRTG